jgi:hypothetical protein
MSDLILRGTVITGGRRIDDGIVAVTGDRIGCVGPTADWTEAADAASVRPAAASRARGRPLPRRGRPRLPGGGHGRCTGAVAHHRAHGTTTQLASLVSAPRRCCAGGSPRWPRSSPTACWPALHLEGPFLAAARCGAQDPAALRPGDPAVLREVLDAAPGAVATMTLAPETARFADLLAVLAEHGVVPSLGHTDATAAATTAAIARRAASRGAAVRHPPVQRDAAACTTARPVPWPRAWPPRRAGRWCSSWSPTACTWPTRRSPPCSTWSGPADRAGHRRDGRRRDADGDYRLGSHARRRPSRAWPGCGDPGGPGAIAGGTAHWSTSSGARCSHAGVDLRRRRHRGERHPGRVARPGPRGRGPGGRACAPTSSSPTRPRPRSPSSRPARGCPAHARHAEEEPWRSSSFPPGRRRAGSSPTSWPRARGRGPVNLGLATGSSPLLAYAELIRRHRDDGLSFAGASAYLLDEYVGLPAGHPSPTAR